jgi:hypothetical protein
MVFIIINCGNNFRKRACGSSGDMPDKTTDGSKRDQWAAAMGTCSDAGKGSFISRQDR